MLDTGWLQVEVLEKATCGVASRLYRQMFETTCPKDLFPTGSILPRSDCNIQGQRRPPDGILV